MSESETEYGRVKLGMIFAGGCGINIGQQVASNLDPRGHSYLRLMYANTDGPQLTYMLEEKAKNDKILRRWIEKKDGQLVILPIGKTHMGAGGIPKVGRDAALKEAEAIQKFIDPLDCLICVGGGGGGTGSGVLPVVAEIAHKAKKAALTILTMPLVAEGFDRMERAEEALKAVRAKCPTIVIYNQEIPNKDQSIKAAWAEINKDCIIQMMLVFQEIVQTVGDVMNLDMADVAQALGAGNRVQFGFSECDDDTDIECVAKTLLGNSYQDKSIAITAKKIVMWRHGDWKVSTFDRLTKAINDMCKRHDRKVEIKCGMVSEIHDHRKWVALLAVAEDPFAKMPHPAAVTMVASEKIFGNGNGNGKGELVRIQCNVRGKSVYLDVPSAVKPQWDKVCALRPSPDNKKEVASVIDLIAALTNTRIDFPGGYDRVVR